MASIQFIINTITEDKYDSHPLINLGGAALTFVIVHFGLLVLAKIKSKKQ